jgi:DNA modification methylase
MVEITEDNEEKSMSVEATANLWYKLLEGDCNRHLFSNDLENPDLTFFDPPYNQGKDYRFFDDNQPDEKYWRWVRKVLGRVYEITQPGGAMYFMQREKNTENVLTSLRKAKWTFQNLIVWKKKTSAVPCCSRFSKQYQIIAYAIKGSKPRVFNKLRIDPPALPWHKYNHEQGVYLTDVWDIREMTSGYFAGDEAIRDEKGDRVHTQQSPISLLLRIILSSSLPGDVILDPSAGTGTTLVVAKQLERNSIGIEIDPAHVALMRKRLNTLRPSDRIGKHREYYRFTENLDSIWKIKSPNLHQKKLL